MLNSHLSMAETSMRNHVQERIMRDDLTEVSNSVQHVNDDSSTTTSSIHNTIH